MAAVRGVKPCRSGIPNKLFSFLFTEIQSFIPIHEIVHSNEMVGYSVQVEFKLLEDKRVTDGNSNYKEANGRIRILK